ncbi:hypothetical protein [Methanohalophilus euhalobius]|uniref:Uncharacterized protein n=1 Tax=Methanohalophilus euhalobius TaxID=51203 RepID=A0A314ZKV0_9EURY|nr:hypothetical protein [Methanohalophilus euhalobius]KXS40938.1 MAG: hypothetical protein AWU58_1820 [Methanohalophilus sp. T328-1]PQV41766.1 hypothetical protein B0H22_1201 [Methanohalophilus euhalobius]RNI11377.1 hypothetical protein EDD83_03060 [Methanohalophilus euhalobius]RSD33726.1 MAG: hypothetical protein CI953_1378 [Methanohalophilus sp.]
MLLICLSLSTISGAVAYEYSVTTIEKYITLSDLDPWSQKEYERIEYWLHDIAGWNEEFYENEYNPTLTVKSNNSVLSFAVFGKNAIKTKNV